MISSTDPPSDSERLVRSADLVDGVHEDWTLGDPGGLGLRVTRARTARARGHLREIRD